MLSKNEEIRADDKCLDYSGGKNALGVKGKIVKYTCHNLKGYFARDSLN